MRLSDRLAVVAIVVTIVIGVPSVYFGLVTAFPSQTKAVTVTPSFIGELNAVLGPNGSVAAGTQTEINGLDGLIFTGYLTHVYLTVSNTGNTPVFLRQIGLSTNVTSDRQFPEAIATDSASIAPGQSQTYAFTLDSQGWTVGVVKCEFTVFGDGVTGSAIMVLGVVQHP